MKAMHFSSMRSHLALALLQIKDHIIVIHRAILLNNTSKCHMRHMHQHLRGQSTTQPTHFTHQLSRRMHLRHLRTLLCNVHFRYHPDILILHLLLSTSQSRYLSIHIIMRIIHRGLSYSSCHSNRWHALRCFVITCLSPQVIALLKIQQPIVPGILQLLSLFVVPGRH